jgi:hypothetical protein
MFLGWPGTTILLISAFRVGKDYRGEPLVTGLKRDFFWEEKKKYYIICSICPQLGESTWYGDQNWSLKSITLDVISSFTPTCLCRVEQQLLTSMTWKWKVLRISSVYKKKKRKEKITINFITGNNSLNYDFFCFVKWNVL